MTVRAVFFDLGETLIDETRHWSLLAEKLDVPLFTFFGVIGGLAARGEHHRKVFEIVRSDADSDAIAREIEESGTPIWILDDLYPDVLPCLRALREKGYHIGIAGNQPARMEAAVAAMDLPVDTIASSAAWGVEKPSPAFFQRIAQSCDMTPDQIAYVGDRLDNDIVPALDAGFRAVFIRRGPWGHLQARTADADRADLQIDTLDGLPEHLRSL